MGHLLSEYVAMIGLAKQGPGSKLQVKTTIDNGGGRRNSKGTKKVNENGMESERQGWEVTSEEELGYSSSYF